MAEAGKGRPRYAREHQKAPPADAFEVQTPASEGTIADVVQVAGTADVAGIGDVAGLGDVDDANHLMGATDLTIAPVEATEAANTGSPPATSWRTLSKLWSWTPRA